MAARRDDVSMLLAANEIQDRYFVTVFLANVEAYGPCWSIHENSSRNPARFEWRNTKNFNYINHIVPKPFSTLEASHIFIEIMIVAKNITR